MSNKNQDKNKQKHLGSFWPIFIVVIVSMIAGGIVYAFASGNIMQDEINSISFPATHFDSVKTANKLPAKPVTKKQTVQK